MRLNRFGVIMAGGGGTRFWPLSRKKMPKQFLNLTGVNSLVNETIDRLADCMKKEDIFVVTNASQADMMIDTTKGRLLENHILAEPAARNTSACVGYAAMEIVKKYGDGIMCIVPSDHFIKNQKEFKRVLDQAMNIAEETDKLITIGIKPEFPSTGYGYIRHTMESANGKKDYFEVEEFVEKPDEETAIEYIKEGNYLWNSGMFIWRASTILRKFEKYLPDVYGHLMKIGDALLTAQEHLVLETVYPLIPKISIDYGIMERADDVLVLKGDFGWSDVGSWDALGSLYNGDENGNVIYGETINLDTKNCIFYTNGKLITAIGVENLVVVETEDAVLVCQKDKAQDVKRIVDKLTEKGLGNYL